MHEYNIAPFDDTKNYKNAFVHDWAFVDAIKRRAVQLKRAHVARFDASETGAATPTPPPTPTPTPTPTPANTWSSTTASAPPLTSSCGRPASRRG